MSINRKANQMPIRKTCCIFASLIAILAFSCVPNDDASQIVGSRLEQYRFSIEGGAGGAAAFASGALLASGECEITVAGSQLPAARLELQNACPVRSSDGSNCASIFIAYDPSTPLAAQGLSKRLLAFVRPFDNATTCANTQVVLTDFFPEENDATLEDMVALVRPVESSVVPMASDDFWTVEPASDDDPE